MNPANVTLVLTSVLGLLPAELGKELLDDVLDLAENKIADTNTKWDDALLLPVISAARVQLDVPDGTD